MPATMDLETEQTMTGTAAKRFLFTHWEGGGNTPPVVALVRGLVQRGHAVRVLGDPCNRAEMEAVGASFVPWTRGNPRMDKSVASDPLKDWEVSSPPALLGRLRDRIFVGPALNYAQDLLDRLREFPADVVATSEMLLGVMAGAEAAGVPCVAVAANICLYPLPGVPPFGPGFEPMGGLLGRLRDGFVRGMALREIGKGTASFNETRRALGLGPIAHPFDQEKRLARHLVMTSAAFDFPATSLPERVVYAGPVLDDPAWTDPWISPWAANDRRPLVLVGFSTTFQNQVETLQRVIEGVGGLDVRAVVTTGPAVDPGSMPCPPNVHLCTSAPHSELLKEAAAVVTHCGHGTVIRSLAAGVPLVCMPMGRDQNDNAARVTARGAGVRLRPSASAAAVRKSVREVLESPGYRQKARELGQRIAEDGRRSPALEILEGVAVRAATR
jgi:UDP:flavonoid glycosyltransferase YjiC (YdhE family)